MIFNRVIAISIFAVVCLLFLMGFFPVDIPAEVSGPVIQSDIEGSLHINALWSNFTKAYSKK